MKFYKENKINPAASCLPILAQIPVFIALFFVLQDFERRRAARLPELATSAGSASSRTSPSRRTRTGRATCCSRSTRSARWPRRCFMSSDDGARRSGSCCWSCRSLPLLHPQLPGRPRPLLGDDQPVDGRAGADHAPADAEADAAGEALARARRRRSRGGAATGRRSKAAGRAGRDAAAAAPRPAAARVQAQEEGARR